jgi:small subunit ribosomal protein S19
LGEFSPTCKFVRHGGKMQKELETKQAETAKAAAAAVQTASPAPKK